MVSFSPVTVFFRINANLLPAYFILAQVSIPGKSAEHAEALRLH